MARRRIIDWKKTGQFLKRRAHPLRSRKGRPAAWAVKLTWFAMLAATDDFGMAAWSPSQIATLFMEEELDSGEITVAEVAQIMESFTVGRDPSAVTWDYDSHRYFLLPKYQDYQRVHNPSNADGPYPPLDVFAKLSPKTQALFREFLDKFTAFTDPSFPERRGAREEEGEFEEEGEAEAEAAASSPSPPRASWPAEAEALRSIAGYPFDPQKDRVLMDALAEAYPQIDMAQEIRKCHAWLASKGMLPVKGQAGPRQRIRNWMGKADQYGASRRPDATHAGRNGSSADRQRIAESWAPDAGVGGAARPADPARDAGAGREAGGPPL